MNWLNYHHLYYFWIVAQELSITRASTRLRVSQSTVSAQIQELESRLGHRLFDRIRKRLILTEAGKVALDYSNTIFQTGQELLDTFENRPVDRRRQAIRVGAVSFLSKNLQIEFVTPVLDEPDLKLVMSEGSLSDLLRDLKKHSVDLVLSNTPARSEDASDVFNHPLGDMAVYLVGMPELASGARTLKAAVDKPLVLPTQGSRLRLEFDSLLEAQGLKALLKAEVEDMALMRLFALSGRGLALVPEIVVRTELKSGLLKKALKVPGVNEKFYAITASRKFPNPWVKQMVRRFSRSLGA